jgi:O-methyltransferase involved in polyketide biosynthesis
VEGASALWIAVDVPTAMAVRERFIAPDEWHLHVPVSVMDRHWFDAVPRGRPVYLTAQGLLMYFEPDEVAGLFRDLAKRFPGAWLAFDHIPRWFARKTLRGFQKTRAYRAPPMPWGINLDEVAPTVRAWVPDVAEVRRLPFRFPRGLNRAVFGIWTRLPGVRHKVPGCTRVRFGLKREAS